MEGLQRKSIHLQVIPKLMPHDNLIFNPPCDGDLYLVEGARYNETGKAKELEEM